jgi:hypothetical protein
MFRKKNKSTLYPYSNHHHILFFQPEATAPAVAKERDAPALAVPNRFRENRGWRAMGSGFSASTGPAATAADGGTGEEGAGGSSGGETGGGVSTGEEIVGVRLLGEAFLASSLEEGG